MVKTKVKKLIVFMLTLALVSTSIPQNQVKADTWGESTQAAENSDETIVTKNNFFTYFDEYGVIKADAPENIKFQGEISNLGVDTITLNKGVSISGENATIINTPIIVEIDAVTIKGIKIEITDDSRIESAITVNDAEEVSILNVSFTFAKSKNTNGYVINGKNSSYLTIKDCEIYYTGTLDERDDNKPIQIKGSSDNPVRNVTISNNELDLKLPSSPVEYIFDENTYTAKARSMGIELVYCDFLDCEKNYIEINSLGNIGDFGTIYGIHATGASNLDPDEPQIVLQENDIYMTGGDYLYGLYTEVDSLNAYLNTIQIKSDYYGNAMFINYPFTGLDIINNFLYVTETAFAEGICISSNMYSYDTNEVSINITSNEIYLKGKSCFGLELALYEIDDNSNINFDNNEISAEGSVLYGIYNISTNNVDDGIYNNFKIKNNYVNLANDNKDSNENTFLYIKDEEGHIIDGGIVTYSANLEDNIIKTNGYGIYAAAKVKASYNDVETTYDYAVSANNNESVITYNRLVAKELIGDNAVYDKASATVSNNEPYYRLSVSDVSLDKEKYDYTGDPIYPNVTVTVTFGEETYTLDKSDYDVEYLNNVNIGEGKIVITGKYDYCGKVEIPFAIVDPNQQGENTDKEQGGNADKEQGETPDKDGGDVPSSQDISKADGPTTGTKIKDKKYIYKVTKPGSKDGSIVGELAVTGLKKKSLKQIKIAAKVTIGAITYKVTSIDKNAFKNNKKITKAYIGRNVVSIGSGSFMNCKKLKQVSCNSTCLESIGKNAFKGDKKLKKFIIKSTKLKKVKKGAFKGVKKSCVIKVPKAKKKKYKKIFKKAGCKGKVR